MEETLPTAKTVIRLLYPYKNSMKTITTDNGCEFATHLEITKKLSSKKSDKISACFADSYCSWQKGAIENANKSIRKYIPKKLISTTSLTEKSWRFKRNKISIRKKKIKF